MQPDVEDDGVMAGEQQPKARRRLSRLQRMTVNKPAGSPSKDQELRHKASPAAKAGFDVPKDAANQEDEEMADQAGDTLPQLQQLSFQAAAADQTGSQQPGDTSAQQAVDRANVHGAAMEEHPSIVTAAPCQPGCAAAPAETAADGAPAETLAATAAPSSAAARQAVRLQDIDLDDDDDEWEDQPAPFMPTDDTDQDEPSAAAAARTAAEDSEAPAYDPSNRRREQYDDEDEWEQLVLKEKKAGTQDDTAGGAEQQEEEEDEQAQQDSVSGSGSGQQEEDNHDILVDDPDAVNVQTQRLLREAAARDRLGKGFKPQVAPLNSILGKLAARQQQLQARSKQRTPAAADAEPQPALTFEQLKAHLEQRSIGNKQQQQQPLEPGRGSSVGEPADNGELECGDVDIDDDLDDLVVEPPQQQQQHQATAAGAAGNMALPETQELLDELQPTVAAGGIVSGTEFVAGSAAPELDLQLDDAAEEEGSGAAEGGEAGSKNEAMAGAQPDGLGEEEAAGSGSDDGEELLDSSDEDLSGEGSGGAEEEEEEEEQQSSEPLAEPLHWEEEEEEIGVVSEPRQQEGADAAAVKREDPAAPAAAGVKKRAVMQRQRAAGGFIEAEADLSDDEGHAAGGDSDDDEDDEDDAELAELIAEVKEGRMDETRRVALHAQWLAGQEDRDMRDLLDAIKRGFRRKRRHAAGLDDDDDGTDAATRRRRAQLLGTLDDDIEDENEEAGTDRLQRLDFQLTEDEGEMAAAAAATAAEIANREKQKRIQKLQLQASESQHGDDVIQLLEMDIDEDSQHTAALLSKSASLATAAVLGPTRASSLGLGVGAGSDSNIGSLRAQAAAGAAKQKALGAAAAGAVKHAGAGAGGGFTFQMFGKDVTNSSKPAQVAGSFIGRQASTSVTVRAASNYGASRSFVFGSDPSNYSNPGPAGQTHQQEDSKLGAGPAVGPSSFAGLSKLIPEAAAKESGRSGTGSGSAPRQQSRQQHEGSLLHLLQERKGGGAAAPGHSILKQHVDAVGAKFKAATSNSRKGAGDDATSRGAWDF